MRFISPLPAEWQENFIVLQQQFSEKLTEQQLQWFTAQLADETFVRELAQVWLGSSFAFEWCLRNPEWQRCLVCHNPPDWTPDHA